MFITRATRHDMADVEEMLHAAGFTNGDPRKGTTFIARDGKVVGSVTLIEVAPQTLIVDDMVVREDRRGEGIGRRLMEAAMNSRGGTMYLCCHKEHVEFYKRFGFTQVARDALLAPVAEAFEATGELTPPDGHEHHFMAAR